MPRRLTLFVALSLIAAFAAASPALGAKRPSAKAPSAKMLECKGSDNVADARSATFAGRMRALSGTDRMGMRFTLLEQFGDQKLQPVEFPELRAWRFSKPGVRDFRFKQTITGLQAGGDYRMKVEFRWLDADGNLQRKTDRVSGACHQPGELPNLRVDTPTASTGPEGTSVYVVTVRNIGKAAAKDVAVELFVDGAATNVGHVDVLAPGESREVRFTGPPCKRGLRMVVDPSDSVKERVESDNVTTSACPALAR